VLFNIPHIAKHLMPIDNEPNHGGVAEPHRLSMKVNDNKENQRRYHRLKELESRGGGSVLHGYYVNREVIENTRGLSYSGLPVGKGKDLGEECYEKLLCLVGSKELDPYREKVAEEMMLCEFMLQQRICFTHINEESAYQGAAQHDFEKLAALGRQLPTEFLDIQAHSSHFICVFWGKNDMVDECIELCGEVYTRICEKNGPADAALQGVVSEMAYFLAQSGKDLERAEEWATRAASNLRSYVRDSDPITFWVEGCDLAHITMMSIIAEIQSGESKAALYGEAEELLYDIISKSEEIFGADSFRVGFPLTCILNIRHVYCPVEPTISSIELAMRAYGIFSRMKGTKCYTFQYYSAFTYSAEVIVDYVITTQNRDSYLMQAACSLITEARNKQKDTLPHHRCVGSLDCILNETEYRLNQLMRVRA
jgi:hypothetical protein